MVDLGFRPRLFAYLDLDFPTLGDMLIFNKQRLLSEWWWQLSPPACVGVPPPWSQDYCREGLPSILLVSRSLKAQGAPSQVAGPSAFLMAYKRENTCIFGVSWVFRSLRAKNPASVSE